MSFRRMFLVSTISVLLLAACSERGGRQFVISTTTTEAPATTTAAPTTTTEAPEPTFSADIMFAYLDRVFAAWLAVEALGFNPPIPAELWLDTYQWQCGAYHSLGDWALVLETQNALIADSVPAESLENALATNESILVLTFEYGLCEL